MQVSISTQQAIMQLLTMLTVISKYSISKPTKSQETWMETWIAIRNFEA